MAAGDIYSHVIRGSTLNWVRKGSLVITLNLEGSVPSDRWAALMTALQVREHEFSCVMGCGIGAVAVDPIQRREISAILKSKRSAAVVDHPMARGLATALGWLGMELRGFSWKDIHKAAEWLAPPGFTADEVVAMALELKKRAELT